MVISRTTTDFTQAFCSALRAYLESQPHAVTQVEIAAALPGARTQSYVSERLAGKKPIDTDMLAAIAELLGCSAPWLIGQVIGRMEHA